MWTRVSREGPWGQRQKLGPVALDFCTTEDPFVIYPRAFLASK